MKISFICDFQKQNQRQSNYIWIQDLCESGQKDGLIHLNKPLYSSNLNVVLSQNGSYIITNNSGMYINYNKNFNIFSLGTKIFQDNYTDLDYHKTYIISLIMYQIEYIYGQKIEDNEIKYAVKWLHYPKKEMTWEPLEHLGKDNMDAVILYCQQQDYQIFFEHIQTEQIADGVRYHQDQNDIEIVQLRVPQPKQEPKPQAKPKQGPKSKKQVKQEFIKQARPKKDASAVEEEVQDIQLEQQLSSISHKNNQFFIDIDHISDDLKDIVKKETKQKQIEEILTEEYYFKLEDALQQLTPDERIIFDKNLKDDQRYNRYEILFNLSILSKEEAVKDVQEILKYEYMDDVYLKPQPKARTAKQQPVVKKPKEQQNKLTKLRRNDETQIGTLGLYDLLQTLQQSNQLYLTTTVIDKAQELGEIGFDKVKCFTKHYFGIPVDYPDDGKIELALYFTVIFEPKEDSLVQFKEADITKQQALFYEKDKLVEYVTMNKHVLKHLAKELQIE